MAETPGYRAAHITFCPKCGRPALKDVTRSNEDGITNAVYVCAGDHLWSVRWVAER